MILGKEECEEKRLKIPTQGMHLPSVSSGYGVQNRNQSGKIKQGVGNIRSMTALV